MGRSGGTHGLPIIALADTPQASLEMLQKKQVLDVANTRAEWEELTARPGLP